MVVRATSTVFDELELGFILRPMIIPWAKRVEITSAEDDIAYNDGITGIGNGTGCPGVFQGNPCPSPSEPVPVHQGTGFDTYGSWVGYNPWVSKPVWDRNTGLHVYHKKSYLM